MDSPPSSEHRLGFFDLDGQAIEGPTEWMQAWLVADVPLSDWEAASITCDGQLLSTSLRRLGGAVRMATEWPRSGPGHYRLQLRTPEVAAERVITIQPSKLTTSEYQDLLEELQGELPGAIAVSLQRLGGLGGVRLLPPTVHTLAAEVVRLRRAVQGDGGRQGLAHVLRAIARDPHLALRTEEEWAPAARARRPHPARLAATMLRAHGAAIGADSRVLDRRIDHSADVYENQLVRSFADQVMVRLRRVLRLLEVVDQPLICEEAMSLLKTMQQARAAASILDDVRPLSCPPDRTTMVLLRRPAYRDALDGYLAFHRAVSATFDSPAMETPLASLPYLYQVWGALSVIAELLDLAADAGFHVTRQQLFRRREALLAIDHLPAGVPLIELAHAQDGTVVTLYHERAYGASGALRSVSHLQKPDIAIEVIRKHQPTSVVIFDPKYKLVGVGTDALAPKKEDIDKMHVYRDAVRDRAGRHVVEFAGILYPGPTTRYDAGLAALCARPGSRPPVRGIIAASITSGNAAH